MVQITGNAYDEIIKIVKEWCNSPGGLYDIFLVTIKLDDEPPMTHLLMFDANNVEFYWENDWWEGEKNVFLYGFTPLSRINIIGRPGDQEFY